MSTKKGRRSLGDLDAILGGGDDHEHEDPKPKAKRRLARRPASERPPAKAQAEAPARAPTPTHAPTHARENEVDAAILEAVERYGAAVRRLRRLAGSDGRMRAILALPGPELDGEGTAIATAERHRRKARRAVLVALDHLALSEKPSP